MTNPSNAILLFLSIFPLRNVVGGHAVEVRQLYDKGKWRLPLALLIIGVGRLMHAQLGDQLFLCEVGVLAQVTDPPIIQTPSLPCYC